VDDPHDTVIVVPPFTVDGTVMEDGTVGDVLVVIEPSSETKRVEGRTKAGRTPHEPVQFVPP
jgi:hypothetical protein